MDDDRSTAAVFGRQLKALRDQRDLTLKDVSRRLEGIGLSASTAWLSRIENAERGLSLDMALAICRALDVALSDLLAAEDIEIGHDVLAPEIVRNLIGGGPWSVEQQLLINSAVQRGIDGTITHFAEASGVVGGKRELLKYLDGVREHGLPDVPFDDESEQS